MMLGDVDRRYVDLARRLAPRANYGALVITLLVVAACATSWERFGLAVGLHAIILPLNFLITAFVVPRLGGLGEVVRAVVNGAFGSFAFSMLGWPMPVWLWLPFIAVSFDQLGGKHTLHMLVIACVIQDSVALVAGVSPLIPLVFTVFAAVCWMMSGARLQMIREMLARAEQQRDELAQAHDQLKAEVAKRTQIELELRRAQKLEAIGRLAAGIAHEINTPMQFIGDSIAFVREGMSDFIKVASANPGADEDVAYFTERLPKALALAADGCERVAAIVRSMKQLAYSGPQDHTAVDLNVAVKAALMVSRHEYGRVAEVETNLASVPSIHCNPGEVGQVLLDLVVNAGHAIEDRVGATGERGLITVTTHSDGTHVTVAISDTGIGISDAIRDRIFDPFFTTKAVGRGTGQSLAVSRALIERYGGTLTFDTTVGHGTTFRVCLPVADTRRAAA